MQSACDSSLLLKKTHKLAGARKYFLSRNIFYRHRKSAICCHFTHCYLCHQFHFLFSEIYENHNYSLRNVSPFQIDSVKSAYFTIFIWKIDRKRLKSDFRMCQLFRAQNDDLKPGTCSCVFVFFIFQSLMTIFEFLYIRGL